MKRVVLDTNVLVSALLFKGRLARLVELWQKGAIVPVISKETFDELRTVLCYPKFALNAEEIRRISPTLAPSSRTCRIACNRRLCMNITPSMN